MKKDMIAKGKQIIYIGLALIGLSACSDDIDTGFQPGAEGLRLSGINAQAVQVNTRAGDVIKGFFPENTHYRLWMYDVIYGTEKPRDGMAPVVGWDITSAPQHYIKLPDGANLNFKDKDTPVKFYGLTDPSIQKSPNEEDHKDFLKNFLTPDEDTETPTYYTVDLQLDTLPDLRAAVTTEHTQSDSYVIPLHFKHILSKVNFQIVKQVGEDGKEMFGELTLEGIRVLNQPTSGTFSIKNSSFTSFSEETIDYEVKGKSAATGTPTAATGITGVVIETKPKKVGSILLFPMIDEAINETNMLRVEVTLGSVTKDLLKPFTDDDSKIKEVDEKFLLSLTCPIYATTSTSDGKQKPLKLEPNYQYDLQFVIMSNEVRIITIVPRVYEWLDGETDGKSDYEEQDMGQPVTFNGVMWSDRNLGASSGHPLRSVKDWMKSVGYYYQYDRNIPYFPNSIKNGKINLNTPLEEAFYEKKADEGDGKTDFGELKRKLYPVVNFLSWKGVNTYPLENQFKPIYDELFNKNDFYVSEIDVLSTSEQNMWGLIVKQNNKGKSGLWANQSTQPCPKGWRLPTKQDFMGVLPGSAFAGNITFRQIIKPQDTGGWVLKPNIDEQEVNILELFKTLGEGGMSTNNDILPSTLNHENNLVKGTLYLGKYPCLFRGEANDPEPNAYSQYVLSMKGDDWTRFIDGANKYRDEGFVYNCGVVYGIKHVGTSKAYRVKWEVKLVSDSDASPKDVNINIENPMYKDKTAKAYEKGIYGVIVISRYTATAKDKFYPDKEGSYEWVADQKDWWANPVEVMYLPICGVAGRWNGGHLYNVGAESWYAMKDAGRDKDHKSIFWIKIAGGVFSNQTLFFEDFSPKYDVVSVRCVRDN